MSVVQVIDEKKQFSPDISEYLKSTGLSQCGLSYDVIAVFGSQSTGKSTLLNTLFGTNFGVMDSAARQQTTKGIWMGTENISIGDDNAGKKKPLLILDVEGTDGRERGEDQDFERKAALFALATSEILLINMWEHQVGLYVGANMALLRTVFEVNLSLFQAGRGQQQRSRIVFVLRDYTNLTPLEKLAATLQEDLEKQWEALAKPEGLEHSQIKDFFDLDFAALPHKVLQAKEFDAQVVDLRKQLENSFKPEYHRNVPIDGWPMYAEQVWQQIEMNKDLDLPTHQILVARFRCDEIATDAFLSFQKAVSSLNQPFGDPEIIVSDFGTLLKKERDAALSKYDETASRYHRTVYEEKRLELLGRVDGVLTAYFGAQLTALKAQALSNFKRYLDDPSKHTLTASASDDADKATGDKPSSGHATFKDRVASAAAAARSEFIEAANKAVVDPSFFSYHTQLQELDTELAKAAEQARQAELRKILKRIGKIISSRLDSVDLHFTQFPKKVKYPWDAVQETLNTALRSIQKEFPEDLGLGGTEEETKNAQLAVESIAWRELAARITALTKQDVILQKLRDRFEDTFRYTEDGLPIVWSPGDDIDAAAVEARKSALLLLPELSAAKLSNGEVLSPPSQVSRWLNSQEEDVPDFVVLITAQQQQEIERRFQRVADAAFVDAKRSVMQLQTHIPAYIFVIIAILGWNEFTMVLRNPLLIVLCLILGGTVYVIHSLGMTSTVLNIVDATFDRTLTEGKAYLREFLLTDAEKSRTKIGHNSHRSQSPVSTGNTDLTEERAENEKEEAE